MKVFISWSGDRSQLVAEALKTLVEDMFPGVKAWVSSQDLEPGSAWVLDLARGLNESDFGILCLTRGNLPSTWVAFEAGAMMKMLGKNRVCPYLIDLKSSELNTPFSLFQSVTANREGTAKLMHSINNNLVDGERLTESRFQRNFTQWWKVFYKTLDPIQQQEDPPTLIEQLMQEIRLLRSKLSALQELLINAVVPLVETANQSKKPKAKKKSTS